MDEKVRKLFEETFKELAIAKDASDKRLLGMLNIKTIEKFLQNSFEVKTNLDKNDEITLKMMNINLIKNFLRKKKLENLIK